LKLHENPGSPPCCGGFRVAVLCCCVDCFRSVSCVSYVTSVSGLSIFDWSFRFLKWNLTKKLKCSVAVYHISAWTKWNKSRKNNWSSKYLVISILPIKSKHLNYIAWLNIIYVIKIYYFFLSLLLPVIVFLAIWFQCILDLLYSCKSWSCKFYAYLFSSFFFTLHEQSLSLSSQSTSITLLD
jgi:hypothetical protein